VPVSHKNNSEGPTKNDKRNRKNCLKNMQTDSLFYETTHISALDIVSKCKIM